MAKKTDDKKTRDPSGKNKWRPSDYRHDRSVPLKIKGTDQELKPSVEVLHDYNLVAMSDFKQNPSAYLLRTEMVPLAISRYGRIEGMLMTVTAFNGFIETIRSLKAELAELRQLIQQTNPDLAKLNAHRPRETAATSNRPVWPMFNHLPARSRTGLVSEKGLAAALTEVRLLTLAMLEAQKEPKSDDDPWQKVPYVHVMEEPAEPKSAQSWSWLA
jgi:hypothetical protein